jgi:uncharacterized protein (TIGR02646 family)
LQKGTRKRKEHQREFTVARAAFRNGTKQFDFDRSIYSAADVRLALFEDQHSKCAFCERKLELSAPVEHFRPKSAVKQSEGDPLERPGYYWLAYDWSNLLLACTECNSRHKGNLFPLANPERRCRSHRGNLEAEEPLFLNPAFDDPENHLVYVGAKLMPKDGSLRGEITIASLDLNRPLLLEHRLTQLKVLQLLHEVSVQFSSGNKRQTQDLQNRILQQLLEKREVSAEYSAMARAFLKE